MAMPLITPARPDLKAFRESTVRPFREIVADLVPLLGRKLTAYIGGAKDVRAVDRWIEGRVPYKDAEERLRFAYRIARLLGSQDHPHVVQAWLTGLNPELGDRVPIRLIRDGDLEAVGPEIIGAARAFAAGG
jgi:hypothetical protein